VLALPREAAAGGPSLSPASLKELAAGTRLLLPSPNGARLSSMLRGRTGFAGCLRNATAVSGAAAAAGQRIAVVAAGEHWPGGSLRPALEDLLGAGALIARLGGRPSDEARAARAAYQEFRQDLAATLRNSRSGQELTQRGFPQDVDDAAAEDVSTAVPALSGDSYRNAAATAAV
jgi:2-phosphosulfolactate phosphatase